MKQMLETHKTKSKGFVKRRNKNQKRNTENHMFVRLVVKQETLVGKCARGYTVWENVP